MKWERVPLWRPRTVTLEKANAYTPAGSAQSRQEHDAFGLDDPWGDGRDDGAVEGSTNQEVFDAYVEHLLAPTPEAGQLVIMDDLSAHKPARVRELIEPRGRELIYPYPPIRRTSTR